QRQFADKAKIVERRRVDFLGYGDHSQGNGQIEAGSFLFNIGRCQIDRGATSRPSKPAVRDGGGHAIATLLHRGIRQTNDYGCDMTATIVHLHFDLISIHTVDRRGIKLGQHRATRLSESALQIQALSFADSSDGGVSSREPGPDWRRGSAAFYQSSFDAVCARGEVS